jgi:protoporphyrinogen oxidase
MNERAAMGLAPRDCRLFKKSELDLYRASASIGYSCDVGDPIWLSSDLELVSLAEHEMQSVGIITSAVVEKSHVERLHGTHPGYQQGSAELVVKMKEQIARNRRVMVYWPPWIG